MKQTEQTKVDELKVGHILIREQEPFGEEGVRVREYVNLSVLTQEFVKKVDDAREMHLAANLIENATDRELEKSFWRAVYSHVIQLAQDLGIEHPRLKLAEADCKYMESCLRRK